MALQELASQRRPGLATATATQHGAGRAATAVSPLPPLTPAEERVAGLVMAGLTSRQVADRLGCSPRTVDTHVEHIRRKRHLATRRDLARDPDLRRLLDVASWPGPDATPRRQPPVAPRQRRICPRGRSAQPTVRVVSTADVRDPSAMPAPATEADAAATPLTHVSRNHRSASQ